MSESDLQFLERVTRSSPLLGPVLARWTELRLPDGWLAAGAVTQTVWNAKLGYPPAYGIRDIDLVYFDDQDLTAEAEQAEEGRIRSLFGDVPTQFDVKNEARVHLWYAARFGKAIAPYRSTEEAIATFPVTASAFGVRLVEGRFEVSAPFGLADLFHLVVRPNKVQISAEVYHAKVSRWRKLWPALDIRPWEEA